MKLPAYPLITVDPYFSIWSKSDELNKSDTELWCGITKRLWGYITVDGVKYRFLGNKPAEKTIQQTDLEILPYITVYTFENEKVVLKVSFWTPLLFRDIHIMSLPCSYIDYKCISKDDSEHSIVISFALSEEFCYDGKIKAVSKATESCKGIDIAKMGQTEQKPLSRSGDGVSVDWGYFLISGGEVSANDDSENSIVSLHRFDLKNEYDCGDIVAFDDVLSIEIFGEKVRSVWCEKFGSIEEAICYCTVKHDDLLSEINSQNEMILNDSKKYGKDYQLILSAAARQVLAAHKLIRDPRGELLYFSKECHSNGCINTVDVTYPAVPMFLCYAPELVKAMLTAIFEFAGMPCWKFDFAPHDIGTYPLADGQVYALKDNFDKRKIIDRTQVFSNTEDIFDDRYQMPVEECGNMIICAYSYYFVTKDDSQIRSNAGLLEKWADYLKNAGIVLADQLCTDDFAGHVSKNVNLAVKSIMGIKCFSEICKLIGSERADEFAGTAQDLTDELCGSARVEDYLTFSLGNKKSWSLKYNLVWDILFDFRLFPSAIYDGESQVYREQLQKYGTPLDYRKNLTKSDWLLWSSVLDKSEKNVSLFSAAIVDYLADTEDRNCFTDWFCTDTAKEKGMDHRSVQAGLWMPVLRDKLKEMR